MLSGKFLYPVTVIVFLGLTAFSLNRSNLSMNASVKAVEAEASGKKFVEEVEVRKQSRNFYQINTKKKKKSLVASSVKKDANTTEVYFARLRNILLSEDSDGNLLDKSMNDFLLNIEISRSDKIDRLWKLVKAIGMGSQKSAYLLDSLGTLLPVELTDELIDTYDDEVPSFAKIKILDMLSNNTDIANPDLQNKERLDFIAEKIRTIQSFLKDDVMREDDSGVFIAGVQAFANISEAEDIQELIEVAKQGKHKDLIEKGELANILSEAAISTGDTQAEMLPDLIDSMQVIKSEDSKQKEDFNTMILESLDAGVLTAQSQQELVDYLHNQEPELQIEKTVSVKEISKYYLWAKSNSKIEGSGIGLEKIAIEESNPLKVSSILLYADRDIIRKIKTSSNQLDIFNRLEAALEDTKLSPRAQMIIKDALKVIK